MEVLDYNSFQKSRKDTRITVCVCVCERENKVSLLVRGYRWTIKDIGQRCILLQHSDLIFQGVQPNLARYFQLFCKEFVLVILQAKSRLQSQMDTHGQKPDCNIFFKSKVHHRSLNLYRCVIPVPKFANQSFRSSNLFFWLSQSSNLFGCVISVPKLRITHLDP